ncbi:type II secretion system F family protein [Bradyrhizobium sp. INPA01-394B]|uniref:Type II secretion system F family protein n=2 Tax=Bacteria TaxID=2 RepID=A0ABR7UC20_9BRAD|nr:type II secretion system F family protein [Bradyrhizobium campsiandrae]MBC9882117.1 type II secretion system F family protein [Bradyrhizobium campsiandrae]MBC9981059.1 type II secretion system F family protein [Bradyrhizobium campsiandrae]
MKELSAFTTELASLVSSGVPVDASFRVLAGAGASRRQVGLANGLLKDILAGLQLSEAMARRSEVFPADYVAILAGGEAGGKASQALTQISEMLVRRVEVRNKIRAALVYPAILLMMSLVSIAVIVLVLIPNLLPIFSDAGLPLPGILAALADLPERWPKLLIWLGGLTAAGLIVYRRIAGDASMMTRLDRLKCRLPVVGPVIQRREAGQFTRSVGSLIDARVPLMTALQTALSLVGNRHLKARYGDAIARVPEGNALSQVLDGDGLLPPAAIRLVAVGEETGQLAKMLTRVAANLETEVQGKIEQFVGLLTPLLTVGIGGLVGALILQVMSAVLSINNLAYQ